MRAKNHVPNGQKRKPAKRPTIKIPRGSATVRVRFSPVKIKGLWYESWIVAYSSNGKACRERAKSEREARTNAEAVATKLAAGDMEALELRGDDRRIYLAAREEIKSIDISLDVAAREYAEAKRIAENADLREVARFYTKYVRTKLKPITIPALIKEMTEALEADNRGDYHVRDLEIRLGRFAKDFPGQVAEMTNAIIDNWLRSLTSLAKGKRRGEKIKGRTRNNYRNAIVELFNYAKKHGYLPKDLATEAAGTNRVSEDDKRDNEIFSPEQIEELLSHARPYLIPGMAIKAFTGVRTEEVAFMEWEHIDFKRGYIKLPKTITKKKRRRIFPIRPNLRKWIEPFQKLKGRICARWSTPQSVFQAWDRFAKKRKIKAGANRFRNSYISYRVAETGDAQKVSLETGNSAAVILEDYLELTTPEEAARWFEVSPTAQNVKRLKAYAVKLHLAGPEEL
jgi:integrase